MLTDEIPNDKFAMKDLIDDNTRFILTVLNNHHIPSQPLLGCNRIYEYL